MVEYQCKTESDSKVAAMLVGNKFWLEVPNPYKAGQGHNLLLPGNCQVLAKFAAASPKYSHFGCHLLVDFWFKGSTLGQNSKVIAAHTATQVDNRELIEVGVNVTASRKKKKL